MKHKIASIGLFAGLVSAAFGQLIVNDQPTSGVALTLQGVGPTVLGYAEVSQPSFTAAGLEFSLISNYNIGDIVIGSGVDGDFFANVSFLGRESLPTNNFGASVADLGLYGGTGTTLFSAYNAVLPYATTKNITAASYQEINFWHARDQAPYDGTFFMNDVLSFRTWEAIDVDANRIYTIFGIDDLRSAAIDFNDGVFLVERNLFPVAFENPVPEPSTYALFGAVALLALVAHRRFKAGRNVSTLVAQ
jgi:hypothetical protein